jgi:hypothetical protein
MSRIGQHAHQSPHWHKEVENIRVEQAESLEAETDAIRSEHPIHNKSKTGKHNYKVSVPDEALALIADGRSVQWVSRKFKLPQRRIEYCIRRMGIRYGDRHRMLADYAHLVPVKSRRPI